MTAQQQENPLYCETPIKKFYYSLKHSREELFALVVIYCHYQMLKILTGHLDRSVVSKCQSQSGASDLAMLFLLKLIATNPRQ